MPGLAHLYIGEEAVAVGVCEALRPTDYITSTHRGHGHCLAKGAAPDRMFAELLGKEAGYCKGKGGSMHIADPATGNLGANAIVCGSAGIATGAAFSSKRLGTDRVAVCFFGEGALGQGLLYEVMNLRNSVKLPVIYVCENNFYTEYTHYSETTAGDVLSRANAFGLASAKVDGQNVRAVYDVAQHLWNVLAVATAPHFSYVTPIDITATMSVTSTASTIDPSRKNKPGRRTTTLIAMHRAWLIEQKLADAAQLSTGCMSKFESEMKKAVQFAINGAVSDMERSGARRLCLKSQYAN